MSRKSRKPGVGGDGVVATNRQAGRDYEILETLEAGVQLKGTEVKSIRAGEVNLRDAFCRIERGEIFLYGCDVQPYPNASHEQHEPRRARRLLLHRREILRLSQAVAQQGLAVVALQLYWKGRRLKVQIGLAKGRKSHDHRQELKKKAAQRETDREIARFNRRGG